MPIYAPECQNDHEKLAGPTIVVERPRLLDNVQSQALESVLNQLVSGIGATGESQTVLTLSVQREHPELPSRGVFVSGEKAMSWLDIAHRLSASHRYMTPEEKAEFDEISRGMIKPLSKPIKKPQG